jgi:hypothetical protein
MKFLKWEYLGLLANALVFFHKPLFSPYFLFPWDFRYVQLPLISLLAEELHRGIFPLWDPFTYCGDPIFANIQASFFHPLVLAAASLAAHFDLDSLPQLLEWAVVLQIFGAAIATFHLFQALGARRPAAFAGAIIFETGGYFVSQTEHIGAVMAVAWMPLAWLATLKLSTIKLATLKLTTLKPTNSRWFATLSLTFGMAILGGFPQATVAVFGSTLVLGLVLVATNAAPPKLIPKLLAAITLGVAIAAIQFLPTSQVTGLSVAKYRADWLATGGGLNWQSFVSLLLPDHYHLFDMAKFNGPGDISFLYLYCSLAGLALAIYSLAARRDRSVLILAFMTLFGAFWMLGDKTPIWRAIFPLLPVSIRLGIHPEYTFANFTLPFAGLAALGLDRLPVRDLFRWIAALVIAADLFYVGSGRPMNTSSTLEEPGLTRYAFDGSADLLQSLRDIVNRDFPPARIDTMDSSVNWAECAALTRVPTAGGSSPLALEAVMRLRLQTLLQPGLRSGWYYQVENPDAPALDLMSVKYILAGPKAVPRLNADSRYRHVMSLPGSELYENLETLPRFRLNTEGRVRTIRYKPNTLELQVSTAVPAELTLAESYYPGWHAWIDNRPTEIKRVEGAFRGISLSAGQHVVRMEFRPGILRIGMMITFSALVVVTAMFVFPALPRRRSRIPLAALLAPALLFIPRTASAGQLELNPETLKAWDQYITDVDRNMEQRANGPRKFLWADESPDRLARIQDREILVSPVGENPHRVPSGMIHHWLAAVFWKGITIKEVLAIVRDYEHYKDIYKPGVVDSKLLNAQPDHELYRLVMKSHSYFTKTAVEGDYQGSLVRLSPTRCYSTSRTIRVQEIDNFGQQNQVKLPPNHGHGYLWQGYGITRYEERDGGVYIEFETIVLSREIPIGLRWIAVPIIRGVARETLTLSFLDTRMAVDKAIADRSIENHGLVPVTKNPVLKVP